MTITTTIRDARAKLAEYGVALSKSFGEYRVRIIGSPLGEGYYTTDLADAVATGIDMAERANADANAVRQKALTNIIHLESLD